jgi:hypothetical protein
VLVISKEYSDSNKLFFYRRAQNLSKFLLSKNLAEHWDLPNTGIFYSKDVASELTELACNIFDVKAPETQQIHDACVGKKEVDGLIR